MGNSASLRRNRGDVGTLERGLFASFLPSGFLSWPLCEARLDYCSFADSGSHSPARAFDRDSKNSFCKLIQGCSPKASQRDMRTVKTGVQKPCLVRGGDHSSVQGKVGEALG